MKDIRTYIASFSPIIFKDEVKLLYIDENQYVAYSMLDVNPMALTFKRPYIEIDIPKDFYEINSEIIPATAITIDNAGTNGKTTDYLIAWFDNTRDSGLDYKESSEAFIGIAKEVVSDIETHYLEKYNDVDDYVYLKSVRPLKKVKIEKLIKDNVLLLDKVPLQRIEDIKEGFYRREYPDAKLNLEFEKKNQDKISIPHKIQPQKDNDWSNIRIAMFDLQKFGGRDVYPFVWIERSEIKIKGEK